MKAFSLPIKTKKSSGFTLIELMISVAIMALIMLLATFSYSIIASRWQHDLTAFEHENRLNQALYNLQSALDGIVSYVVVDKNRNPNFFFIGGKESLLAVTKNGFWSNEAAEIFRLSINTLESGKQQLVYQAKPLNNTLLKNIDQVINFSHQVVLLDDIDKLELQYLGWRHFSSKNNETAISKSEWRDRYSGIDNQLIPIKINVNLTVEGKTTSFFVTLEQDAERRLSYYLGDDNDY